MPATATKIAPPQPGEYAEYYHKYIALVPQGEITGLLEKQGDEFAKFLESVADADASIVHPPYGWTIKQVVSHIVDGDLGDGGAPAAPFRDHSQKARSCAVRRR